LPCFTADTPDLSQKNPYHSLPLSAPVRSLLPLFASGCHRIALTSNDTPRILTSALLLEHLISLSPSLIPTALKSRIANSKLPLHALVSLPGSASVLDAMQVMSTEGLSALGVLSGTGRVRRESSGSSSSQSGSNYGALTASPMLIPLGSPAVNMDVSPLDSAGGSGELVSIVTARECASLVVPSEGKQILGMGLEQMVKALQVVEEGGTNRGEERVPGEKTHHPPLTEVNMVTQSTTLLHAGHLILATSTSRVFLRSTNDVATSPPVSPVPSLSMSASSPPVSPSIASLSLNDYPTNSQNRNLPRPPPVQLSPHYVISILDILSCLAKSVSNKLAPLNQPTDGLMILPNGSEADSQRNHVWDLDPAGMGKRRRASSFADPGQEGGLGFGTWRWAGRVGKG